MKVKIKILILATISVIVLTIITCLIFYSSYFGYIKEHEKESVQNNYEVIDYIMGNEEEDLNNVLLDWAQWDDTYEFVDDLNNQYLDSNLNDDSLKILNLKGMYFFNNEGKLVYQKSYGIENDKADKILKESLLDDVSKNPIDSSKNGLIIVDKQLYLIAKAPISLSEDKSKINGSLVFLKEVDEKVLSYIDKVSNISLKYRSVIYNSDVNPTMKIDINHVGRSVDASQTVKDINGEDSIVFDIHVAEDSNVIHFFNNFIIIFSLIITILVIVDLWAFDKYILKRLLKLSKFVEEVAATRDTSRRVEIHGEDEIAGLAQVTNGMLIALDSAYDDMKKMDNIFKIIMEATNDGYLDMNVKAEEMYISDSWKAIIGYEGSDKHELFINYFEKVHPECLKRLEAKFLLALKGEIDYFSEEYRIVKEPDNIIWVQHRGKIVEWDEFGRAERIVSTLSDITERKKSEEEVIFLSYSDKLTGLKNRTFMEKEFQKLDRDNEVDYFIIMVDINGLKLINDILGHKEGDKVLIKLSEILMETCPNSAIICRWGGDEFVILIRDGEEDYISDLIDEIKETALKKNNLSISVSLGYAREEKETKSSEVVMNLAEERMYKNKLLEDKSARSATVNSLLRSLFEKHTETQEHTMRIRFLSNKLGKKLGLKKDVLDELELVATLHDIGKIGIPDSILLKPGKLTQEEWAIMKSHSIIGYRIANSTPELAHIAYEILAHHEKFDGTGYPNNLKGDEIPLLSRIINIVDSFDVMTHKRAYKEAFDKDYVIEELKRCSGGQFDPELVDKFLTLLEEEIYNYKE